MTAKQYDFTRFQQPATMRVPCKTNFNFAARMCFVQGPRVLQLTLFLAMPRAILSIRYTPVHVPFHRADAPS